MSRWGGRLRASIPVLAVWLLLGIRPVRAAEPGAAAPAAEVVPLRFGAVGFLKSRTRASVEPIVTYLSRGLGREIRLVMYPSYNDILVALAEPSIDLALLSPVVFLNARGTLEIRSIANAVYPNGRFTYDAVVLARKDDPAIRTLEDLTGKPMGFVDLFSASGYVVPKLMLEERGVGARTVKDRLYGNHADVLAALDAGEVAAGATYDIVFRHLDDTTRSLDDYRILARSDPIPSDQVVASSRVEATLVDRVQDLLLRFYGARKDEPDLASSFYIGFIPPDPSVYTSLEAIHEKVLGPLE